MASQIKAINAYRPKVEVSKRTSKNDLIKFIARSTGLNEGPIDQVLDELRDAILFYNLQGMSVYLEGLGTYSPKISLDGTFGIAHRADMKLKNGLNAPQAFSGQIANRENIGMTSADLVVMWNEDHPEDPVA
jgi:nucleoid DNA-binding protein